MRSFARSLLSPTALALALTTALSPLAAASGFAKPPSGWAGAASTDSPSTPSNPSNPSTPSTPSEPVAPAPIPVFPDHNHMRPPVIVTKAAVRAALEQARTNSLDAFKVYFTNEVYPSNTYTKGALNVWRDDDGHYCAAATIIRISGRIAISEEVPATNNNLRLIYVTDGVLMDWILTSGLTQQEIAAIQRPFMGVRPDGSGQNLLVPSIDPAKKVAETKRLAKEYRATYAKLLKNNDASLDVAVNRLMAHPDLAREFLDGSLAIRDIR